MKVEIVGSPEDGRTVEVEDGSTELYVPVFTEYVNGPLDLIPKYSIAKLPIHDNGKVYWNETLDD